MREMIVLPFRRFADFSGRSRRREYWGFVLLNLGIAMVMTLILAISGFSLMASMSRIASMPTESGLIGPLSAFIGGLSILLFLWFVIMIVPGTAVAVRRLHDQGISGWFLLLFFLFWMLSFARWWIGGLAWLVLLVLLLRPGTRGPNRYGDDPRDPTGAEIFA